MGGCAATPPAATRLPDGSVAYRINCDATAGGLNYCFENAGKTCGAEGYSIVGSDGRFLSTSDVADSDLAALTLQFENDSRSILIKCGE
jgi:hypothetical protein